MNAPLVLSGNSVFSQQQGFVLGSELVVGGQVTIGAGRVLTLTGLGTHTITGSLVDGALTVDKRVNGTNGFATLPLMPLLDGPITVHAGSVQFTSDMPCTSTVNSDGVLQGAGHVGSLTSTTAGGVVPGFTTRGVITADGNADFGAGRSPR